MDKKWLSKGFGKYCGNVLYMRGMWFYGILVSINSGNVAWAVRIVFGHILKQMNPGIS